MTDDSGTTHFKYDQVGRVIIEKWLRGGSTFLTSYWYDRNGNLESIQYPSSRDIDFNAQASDVDRLDAVEATSTAPPSTSPPTSPTCPLGPSRASNTATSCCSTPTTPSATRPPTGTSAPRGTRTRSSTGPTPTSYANRNPISLLDPTGLWTASHGPYVGKNPNEQMSSMWEEEWGTSAEYDGGSCDDPTILQPAPSAASGPTPASISAQCGVMHQACRMVCETQFVTYQQASTQGANKLSGKASQMSGGAGIAPIGAIASALDLMASVANSISILTVDFENDCVSCCDAVHSRCKSATNWAEVTVYGVEFSQCSMYAVYPGM